MTAGGARAFRCVYQSFAELGGPAHGAARVKALRAELAARGLDGFVAPRADEHQNEYVPAAAERLMWLTGFSGSAGMAVVLKDAAAIFVDGRYAVQAPAQVDPAVFAVRHLIDQPPGGWIEANLQPGQRLGYDPWLHTPEMVERLSKACRAAGGELVAVDSNPIDAIWSDRPAAPLGAVTSHSARLSGESAAKKIGRVRAALATNDGLLVSDAHAVAWLFNIRGADVAHTPLPLSFAYAPREGKPTLFVDGRKLSNAMRARLGELAEIDEPDRLVPFMASLGERAARVAFDASSAPARLTQALEAAGGAAVLGPDPIALMKATKNKAELAGTRAAHIRDGAAMARFLCWFDREAPKGKLSEIAATEALETFRRETGALKDVSFPTIAGAGPHAAIPHYRVSEASNLRIGRGIFLVDSGGQYEDGTTDITRTIVVGRPSAEMRDRFTRVLQGHIAIAQAVFPRGTSGAQIDALARQGLWRAGLDFDHGTGHGVGSYLSVHEGPQRIAKTGTVALAPGMILSNEPGYYAPGGFGIRIENLVVVEERTIAGAERAMLGFETISLAPIDLRLVERKLLDREEVAWLDGYHARVRAVVGPLVDRETRAWLKEATRRVG
ncbi:MAG: aminopeptidase P family protein [Roseiarcus sp.]